MSPLPLLPQKNTSGYFFLFEVNFHIFKKKVYSIDVQWSDKVKSFLMGITMRIAVLRNHEVS